MAESGATDLTLLVNEIQLGNRLLAKIYEALATGVAVDPTPTSYTVAALPASGGAGQFAWASNGRKPGEGAGAGTGVPVFWNAGTSQWFSYLSGAVVAA